MDLNAQIVQGTGEDQYNKSTGGHQYNKLTPQKPLICFDGTTVVEGSEPFLDFSQPFRVRIYPESDASLLESGLLCCAFDMDVGTLLDWRECRILQGDFDARTTMKSFFLRHYMELDQHIHYYVGFYNIICVPITYTFHQTVRAFSNLIGNDVFFTNRVDHYVVNSLEGLQDDDALFYVSFRDYCGADNDNNNNNNRPERHVHFEDRRAPRRDEARYQPRLRRGRNQNMNDIARIVQEQLAIERERIAEPAPEPVELNNNRREEVAENLAFTVHFTKDEHGKKKFLRNPDDYLYEFRWIDEDVEDSYSYNYPLALSQAVPLTAFVKFCYYVMTLSLINWKLTLVAFFLIYYLCLIYLCRIGVPRTRKVYRKVPKHKNDITMEKYDVFVEDPLDHDVDKDIRPEILNTKMKNSNYVTLKCTIVHTSTFYQYDFELGDYVGQNGEEDEDGMNELPQVIIDRECFRVNKKLLQSLLISKISVPLMFNEESGWNSTLSNINSVANSLAYNTDANSPINMHYEELHTKRLASLYHIHMNSTAAYQTASFQSSPVNVFE
jgi:hypothetical protein